MVHQKKTAFFRKITSKMVNAKKERGDQGRNHPDNQVHGKKKGQEHLFLDLVKELTSSFDHAEKNGLPSSTCAKPKTSPVQESPAKGTTNSGLLAAKLKCDEWGLQSPKSVPRTTKKIAVPTKATDSSVSNTSPVMTKTVELRINRSQHPSYKPPTPRYRSMKERREAKEKMMKFGNFQTSLFRIDEVDEKGIE